MDLIQELNYICNSEIFRIAYAMKITIPSKEERNRIILWMKKIMKYNKTLSDLRLRNEFLEHLAVAVQEGELNPPFNQDPPRATLKTLARQLPGRDDSPGQDDESVAMLRFLPARHGGFLLPKPLPQIGAYCYIAASAPCTRSRSE